MKTFFMLPLAVVLVLLMSFAEEVPPTFDKGETGKIATERDYDPHEPPFIIPKQARVRVEYVEMAHKELTRLLMADKPQTADATALRMKVQEMVEKDQAKVIETQMVNGRSGNKFTTYSREEFIYPTEFTPIEMDEKTKKLMEEAVASPFCMNPAFPTGFETRNLGSSLETEPTVGEDGKYIDLRFVTQLAWHTGNTIWHEGKDSTGNDFKLSMPEIYVVETNTSFTCMSGQYTLAGVLSPKNAEGKVDAERKVMVFVKCDILPVAP